MYIDHTGRWKTSQSGELVDRLASGVLRRGDEIKIKKKIAYPSVPQEDQNLP